MRSAGFRRKPALAAAEDYSGSRLAKRSGCRLARPMPTVASGVSELRVKGEDGIFRVFYFTATAKGVLVFHAFTKKTQRTPPLEIELGKKRLKELIDA